MLVYLGIATSFGQTVSVTGMTCPDAMDLAVTGVVPTGRFVLFT